MEIVGINIGLASAAAALIIWALNSAFSSRRDSITHGIEIGYLKEKVAKMEREIEALQAKH